MTDREKLQDRGILYGIGAGPGDPELLTLKAVRCLKEADVIAAPGKDVREAVAFRIAVQAVPELLEKELLPIDMPMVMDRKIMETAHRAGASALEQVLEQGKNIAFITLGDPTVYSTFTYLEAQVRKDGYPTAYVSGVTSFCAAAAALRVPLAEWQEPLHIIPAVHRNLEELSGPGSCVLMKSGRRLREVKESLKASGRRVFAAVNVGMEDEALYRTAEEIPDDAGYFSLIIAKAPEEDLSEAGS